MVTRGDVGLLFGLAGFLLGGSAYYHHFKLVARMDGADQVSVHDDEMQGQFAERITALETHMTEANKRVSALQKELSDGMNDLAAARGRIDALERSKPK